MIDSLFINQDSLQEIDSVAASDTLLQTIPFHSLQGMEGEHFANSAANEPWVFILVLLLFAGLAVLLKYSDWIRGNLKTIVTFGGNSEPLSQSNSGTDIRYNLFYLFTLSVFSLAAYQMLYAGLNRGEIVVFLKIFVILAFYILAKYLLFNFVGWTLVGKKITQSYKGLYFSLVHGYAIALFPFLILAIYADASYRLFAAAVGVLILALSYIFLIIKIFKLFQAQKLVLLYIFLYLCTLEILPILILFQVIERFV